MNQQKTGRFIAAVRKEQGLTQSALAESLCISDKTVSKWETGKGLPEVSLMLPLCEKLGISVNELLLGERIAEKDYRKKSEEVIMDLVKERIENKRKTIIAVVVTVITLIASLTLFLVSDKVQIEGWLSVLLMVIGFVTLFGGLGCAAALEWNAGTYECRKCGHRFDPTFTAYLNGVHTLTTRRLKCPKCGEVSWCRRRWTH